jgi:8-oxo-dGTP pyrophosphatase MutT (NUDIX family)
MLAGLISCPPLICCSRCKTVQAQLRQEAYSPLRASEATFIPLRQCGGIKTRVSAGKGQQDACRRSFARAAYPSDMSSNPWKTLASRVVYENAWVRLREDAVVRPDGKQGIYGVVELRPSVGVVALNGEREIVLVGQWRYPLGRYSWEIPRGGSGVGESDLLAVAQRELREETGVEARRWQRLGAVDLNNGVTDDVEHLFLATEVECGETRPDPEEELAVRWVPFATAVQMALGGEITEVCTVAAILMAARMI